MEMTLGSWRVSVKQVPPTSAELATMYNNDAPHWHRSISLLGYSRAYNQLFAALKVNGTLTHLPENGHVLDCGIGTGGLSLALVKQTSPTIKIHGIDIAEKMLTQADERLRQVGITPSINSYDVRNLPFENNSFNLVMSAHMLEHLSDPLVGLREMVRVLQPGAPLISVVTRRSLFSAWLRVRWQFNAATPAVLTLLMKSAGLENAQLYQLGGPPWCKYMSIACVGFKQEVSR